jgi:hypothetical protein
MIYDPGFTDPDRASLARAIRQLAAKGEVINYYEPGSRLDGQWVESGMWVRRPDVPHVETARLFEMPATDANGARRKTWDMSRAELLEADPSYGDREDCRACGMPNSECFLLGDNMGKPGRGTVHRIGVVWVLP